MEQNTKLLMVVAIIHALAILWLIYMALRNRKLINENTEYIAMLIPANRHTLPRAHCPHDLPYDDCPDCCH